jgi:hypothetical protein
MVFGRGNGSYRSIILALAGLALVGTTPQKSSKSNAERSEAKTEKDSRAPAVTSEPAKPVKIVQAAVKKPPCGEGQYKSNDDLCAQWKAADAASKAAWWAMVATIITAFGTFGLFWQIKLTREAVQDTGDATVQMSRQTKIAEAAQRPYLHIETMGWERNKRNGHWFFELLVKNFGLSPASGVIVNADVRFSVDGKPPSAWNIRKCDISDLMPQGKIEGVVVNSADTRIKPDGNADVSPKEDIYCRFEIRYRDAFGNEYGIFETYKLDRDRDGESGKFRFFSTP